MPEGAIHDAHPDEQLLAALQYLTPQQRAVIVLHYYVDCPVREISRRTRLL
jgi:DNA-directed RNA polymerase specialized sigma24 family protein